MSYEKYKLYKKKYLNAKKNLNNKNNIQKEIDEYYAHDPDYYFVIDTHPKTKELSKMPISLELCDIVLSIIDNAISNEDHIFSLWLQSDILHKFASDIAAGRISKNPNDIKIITQCLKNINNSKKEKNIWIYA